MCLQLYVLLLSAGSYLGSNLVLALVCKTLYLAVGVYQWCPPFLPCGTDGPQARWRGQWGGGLIQLGGRGVGERSSSNMAVPWEKGMAWLWDEEGRGGGAWPGPDVAGWGWRLAQAQSDHVGMCGPAPIWLHGGKGVWLGPYPAPPVLGIWRAGGRLGLQHYLSLLPHHHHIFFEPWGALWALQATFGLQSRG